MRKVLGIVLFCFIFSFVAFCQDSNPLLANRFFTLEEKIAKVKELISLSEKKETQSIFSERDLKTLHLILDSYEEGWEDLGDQFLQFLLIEYEKILKETRVPFSPREKIILTTYLFKQYPHELRNSLEKLIDAYVTSIQSVYSLTKKHRGLIESYEVNRNEEIDLASEELCAVLVRLKAFFKSMSLESLQEFVLQQKSLAERIKLFMASVIQRHSTVKERSQELQASLVRFIKGENFFEAQDTLLRLKAQEEKEAKIQIIFNRQTITAAGLAALLIGESLSWYTSGSAIPSTVAKLSTTLSAVGSMVVATNSALNIADRYMRDGFGGVLTWDNYVDWVLISALPWRSLKNVPDALKLDSWKSMQWLANTSVGKKIAWKSTKYRIWTWRKVVESQYQAMYMLGVAATGMGIWKIIYADEISERCQRNGIRITPDEIRKSGIYETAMGLLGGGVAYNRSKAYVKAYERHYKRAISGAQWYGAIKADQSILARWNTILNPVALLQSMVKHLQKTITNVGRISRGLVAGINSVSSAQRNLKLVTLGTYGLFKNGFRLTLETLWAQSYALLLYSYPDILFMKKVDVPDLNEGEIALALNGFSPTDLLYYAARMDLTHSEELKKYEEGKNFFGIDYTSPEEFIQKIEEMSQRFGKIKYLKILTHGLPGHLTTRKSPNIDSFIDIEFLTKEEKRIKEMAKKAFAPDARIVLISCLVGGNLEENVEETERRETRIDKGKTFEITQRGQIIEKDEADQFIKTLGDVLLVNGGRLDSSRNIMLLLSGTIGAFIRYIFVSSNYDEITKAKLAQDLQEMEDQVEEFNIYLQNLDTNAKILDKSVRDQEAKIDVKALGGVAMSMITKIIYMQMHMLDIIQKYGLNLKGNLFESRHRTDYFKPHD